MDSYDIFCIFITILIIIFFILGLYFSYDEFKTQYKVIDYDNNEYIVNGSDLYRESMIIDLDNKRILIKSWEEIK